MLPGPSGKAAGTIQLLEQPVCRCRFEIPLVLGGKQGSSDPDQLPFEDFDLTPGCVCLPDQEVRRGISIRPLQPEQSGPLITVLLSSGQCTEHTQFFNSAPTTKICQDLTLGPVDPVKSANRTLTD